MGYRRFFNTELYRQPWFRALSPAYKNLWFYINLECNDAGFWLPELDVASSRIGEKVLADQALEAFKGQILPHPSGEWEVVGYLQFQYPNGIDIRSPRAYSTRKIFTLLQGYFPGVAIGEGGDFAGRVKVISTPPRGTGVHPVGVRPYPSEGNEKETENELESETENELEDPPLGGDKRGPGKKEGGPGGGIVEELIVAAMRTQFQVAGVPCTDVPPFTKAALLKAAEEFSQDAVKKAIAAYLSGVRGRPRTAKDLGRSLDELLQQTKATARPECVHEWRSTTKPDERWPEGRAVRWKVCKKCSAEKWAKATLEDSTFKLPHVCEADLGVDEFARISGLMSKPFCKHCGDVVPSAEGVKS